MGLIYKARQQQPQAPQNPQQQTQPPQQAPPQEGQQPQIDQQEIYERIAEMALGYVNSEAGADMVMEGLRLEHGDIIKNAGNIVAKILMRLIITARTSGGAIPPKVMIQVGMETTIAVLQIVEADQELPNAEAGMVDAVFYAAVTITGKELPDDMLSAQERQEVSQTLAEVQQMQGNAQQQGNLQQVPQQLQQGV
jgi:hypothetical protein